MYRNKRPNPTVKQSTSSTESSSQQESSQEDSRSAKRLKQPIFDSRSKIFIINDKLEIGQKEFLDGVVTAHGGKLATSPVAADLIVTAIDAPKRLQRTIPDAAVWPTKTFVGIEWIEKSIEQGSQADKEDYIKRYSLAPRIDVPLSRREIAGKSQSASPPSKGYKIGPTSDIPFDVLPRATATDANDSFPTYTLVQLQDMFKSSHFACERFTPLICINDALVRELNVIKRGRKTLDGDETSSLSYGRAISAIKAWPWKIDEATDLVELQKNCPGVGDKVVKLIRIFLKDGSLPDANRYRESSLYRELQRLEQIHGVGAKTARELAQSGHTLDTVTEFNTELIDDFNQGIPRVEVEEIGFLVAEYLEIIQPGCEYTITGGYRRGKPASNDIDIVISHRELGKEKHILSKLVAALTSDGIIVRNIYTTNTGTLRPLGAQNFHASAMDPLDKTFCVFLPPRRGHLQAIHRRVDLIIAPWTYYFTAIVGWSGSTMFERDIRRWAEKRKNLKFDSGGLTHRTTSQDVIVTSERHLFEIMGLEYIPPNYRCQYLVKCCCKIEADKSREQAPMFRMYEYYKVRKKCTEIYPLTLYP